MAHYQFGLGEVIQEIDKGVAHAEEARKRGGFVDRECSDYYRGYRDALNYIRGMVVTAANKTIQ